MFVFIHVKYVFTIVSICICLFIIYNKWKKISELLLRITGKCPLVIKRGAVREVKEGM